MWVGSVDDLKKLIKICRDLEARTHEQIRAALAASEPERREEFQRTHYIPTEADAIAEWETAELKEIDDTIDRIKLTMELTFERYGEKLIGEPEDLVNEINRPRDVQSIALNCGYQPAPYKVPPHSGFRVSIDKYGATATIFGANRESIDIARPKLFDEFRAQRPWYWWMATWWGNVVVAYLPIGLLVSILFPPFVQQLPPAARLIAWIAFGVFEALLVVWAVRIWPRLLPMFELIVAGTNAHGRLALGAIGAGALWIIGSVVVPLMLARITGS